MKKLKKEQMEKVVGGRNRRVDSYCATLLAWLNGEPGYQGSVSYLAQVYGDNCTNW